MKDANGNPDVMGPWALSKQQRDDVDQMYLAFNALHAVIERHDRSHTSAEAARLFSIAGMNLELACMAAVKGISRK